MAVPGGNDIHFENDGRGVLDAVLPLLNPKDRIPVCGLVSQFNATSLPRGPERMNLLSGAILRGFIVFDDFRHLFPEFEPQMDVWIRAAKVQSREEVIEGPERVSAAFVGLLKGKAFGKRVVRLTTRPHA